MNQCVFGSKAQRHQLHQYYMCVFSGGRVCCCVSVRAGLSCGTRPSQSRAASKPSRSLRSSHGFNADTGRDTTALTRAPCTHNSPISSTGETKETRRRRFLSGWNHPIQRLFSQKNIPAPNAASRQREKTRIYKTNPIKSETSSCWTEASRAVSVPLLFSPSVSTVIRFEQPLLNCRSARGLGAEADKLRDKLLPLQAALTHALLPWIFLN